MTQPFIGEVQILGFSFAPSGWALAAGQLVAIRQATSLYSLYGTQFGGDGTTTFALPNLASRLACGNGQSPGNSRRQIGQTFGSATVALTATETPMHNHVLSEYNADDISTLIAVPTAASAIGFVADASFSVYAPVGSGATTMNPSAIGISGNGSPHENCQPYLGLTYAVALTGNYPTFG